MNSSELSVNSRLNTCSCLVPLRAIIPDLMRFAYTSTAELRVHSDQTSGVSGRGGPGSRKRDSSPDLYIDESKNGNENGKDEGEEKVLVLDFVEAKKTKKVDLQT